MTINASRKEPGGVDPARQLFEFTPQRTVAVTFPRPSQSSANTRSTSCSHRPAAWCMVDRSILCLEVRNWARPFRFRVALGTSALPSPERRFEDFEAASGRPNPGLPDLSLPWPGGEPSGRVPAGESLHLPCRRRTCTRYRLQQRHWSIIEQQAAPPNTHCDLRADCS